MLGGTLFLGPAVVEAAIAEGHTVTLFNRGITNPSLFPNVEKLRGFRSANLDDQNLSALGTRHWDVVIDVWPNDPVLAESAARLLKDRTDHYLYISSIAAYDKTAFEQTYVTENSPLTPWNVAASGYSRGKAESERRLADIVGEKLTIVRPGGIKGVRDDTPDLLIWLRRLQTQPGVIVPGTGEHPVAVVDVRDIADFLLLAIEKSIFGTFNLAGRWMPFRTFLEQCKNAIHSDSELVWVPESFLQEQGVYPQSLSNWLLNFPYCRADHGSLDGSPVQGQISDEKALTAGWQIRPLRDTVLDCLASFSALGNLGGYTFRDTLPPARQVELLRLWRDKHPT
ncbi:NAD-dependent epimerase/dehydratase family protein [Terriglobus albidus]|uniref:NAD-dependent epimerase/dehydratase family protein n=1 Tax=Terriglobus albidus TaxID=1592106 RepID=UPI00164DEDF8|nr:NAD-dependent epimerase/dehydratase family protein [Terriglobus albidus]